MTQTDYRDQQIEALQDRLTRLSEASLRINDSLELDTVLQRVLDSARALTGARYGVMTTFDESGQIEDFLASGLDPEEARQLWAMPGGIEIFEYLNAMLTPLRVADFGGHTREMGLPEFNPPAPTSSFLAVPIRHRGDVVGNINMAKREPGQEFSREDEETLVMFASQAALVIANARRHRDERRARADLETLINTSPVGVAVFNARTGIPESINREGLRIVDSLRNTDQAPEGILDELICRRADGREISLKEWPLSEALSAGETVRAEEIVLSVPDGRSVTVLLNATPIRSESGQVESFIITIQDMTPLKELERLRADFLGMVSHELRSPLASIRGSATTMQEVASDLDPAELRQFLRIIVDQADSMRELIDDLLDVARIESGALRVNPEPTEVVRLVDRAKSIFLSAGGRNNLDIEIASDLPLVMADRRRLVQVIGNLLANAARHSPDESTIRVSVKAQDVHVAISVADEGRGIPTGRLPRLFGKFQGIESKEQSGDTGLGLAICKGIVEAHGGRIWAESEGPSLGARFTFTVPPVGQAGSEAYLSAQGGEASLGEPVLVVDDDPQMLRYVRRTLSGAGYNPTVTAEPAEALRLATEIQPRLILLDMMLPGFDGIELMGDFFGISDAPVVFLSAYGQEAIISRAFEMGATDYIVKPFTPTELVARVRGAMLRLENPYRIEPTRPYTLGDLTIDYSDRTVTIGGRPLRVTAKEYGLLFELSVNGGRVVTHEQLLRRVWTTEKPGNVRALRAHLRRLRRKMDEDARNPKYIFSESRVGYRMPKGETTTPIG